MVLLIFFVVFLPLLCSWLWSVPYSFSVFFFRRCCLTATKAQSLSAVECLPRLVELVCVSSRINLHTPIKEGGLALLLLDDKSHSSCVEAGQDTWYTEMILHQDTFHFPTLQRDAANLVWYDPGHVTILAIVRIPENPERKALVICFGLDLRIISESKCVCTAPEA